VQNKTVAKWFLFFSVSLAWISLDQFSKVLVLEHLRLGQTTVAIPNLLNWTYVSNPGAAFGFLGQTSESFRNIFFLLVTPLAAFFVVTLMRTTKSQEWFQILSLASIFGGAMGNFIDRIRFRFVIDFIDIYFTHEIYIPAFNLADVAIVVGALGLLLCIVRDLKRVPNE
jgi:signal peptidase II